MEVFKRKFINDGGKIMDYYWKVFDILTDDNGFNWQRAEWKLFPTREPIEKICDEDFCKRCQETMVRDEQQSFCVCISCGQVKPIFIFKQNYKDITYEFIGYTYQRITHFRKHKPKNRKNFFNYKYVLIKLFELFKQPHIRKHLQHLKSKEKLAAHDKIWKKICKDMKWKFHPSRRLVEHKRSYKGCYRKRKIKK